MMNELMKRLEELARLEQIANRIEAEYEAEPMSAEKEAAFDEAYAEEYAAFIAIAELIVKMTGGRVDIKTAREMVRTKRSDILNLVA